ncbi:MAG: hypothetical protein RLY95_570, partial [Pseudomonadota bacterium]
MLFFYVFYNAGMSILCDTQINELAAKGMIEPFSPKQVKQVDGNRVISYGTS